MIRGYKHLIKLQHIHTEQMQLKCVRAKVMMVRDFLVEKYEDCAFFDEIILEQQGQWTRWLNYIQQNFSW